jgi:AcrR family transcriptional regulator
MWAELPQLLGELADAGAVGGAGTPARLPHLPLWLFPAAGNTVARVAAPTALADVDGPSMVPVTLTPVGTSASTRWRRHGRSHCTPIETLLAFTAPAQTATSCGRPLATAADLLSRRRNQAQPPAINRSVFILSESSYPRDMTTEAKSRPRERLLEAAATLSYQEGAVIGVDALCKAAGVSKRSMYQLFESKDELLAASLAERAAAFVATLLPPADDGRSPRERILHVFDQLQSQAGAPDFQGCRYLSIQVELKDQSHPASQVAHRVKGNLTAFFRAEAEQGAANDPDLLARQLILVFDGASARAGIGADTLTSLVAPTVAALLDAATVR